MDFYNKLIELCAQKGVSRSKMADDIGISRSAPQGWAEKGAVPRFDTIKKIADYFDVDVESLLEKTDLQVQPLIAAPPLSYSAFYKRVLSLCKKSGLSVTALALALGFSKGTPTNWKSNAAPRPSTVKKVADYFGVPVSYFLDSAENGQETEKQKEPAVSMDGEPEENVIIFHRNGKTQKKKFTKEQMAMFMAMVDALPDTDEEL